MLKIPFFRLGTWKHPKYGPIEGTQQMFDAMTENFRKQALGREPFIRIGHDKDGSKTTFGDAPAEGWIKDLVQEGPILFAVADPTNEEVVEAIKSKRYRFASAEYDQNYLDKESGQRVGPVLSAVSLTNEPFLTKLPEAVVLADPPETFYMDYEEVENVTFDPKKLSEQLDENTGLLRTLADGFKDFFSKFKPEGATTPPVTGAGTELPDDIKAKLAAGAEAERKLAEQVENEKKTKLADEKTKLADLKTSIETKGNALVEKGIAPAVVNKAKEILLAAVTSAEEVVVKLAENNGEMMGPNGKCECVFCGNMPLCGSRGYMPLGTSQLADQVFAMLEALPEENRIKFSQNGAGTINVPQGIDATVLAEDIKFLGGTIREDGSIKV